MQPTRVFIHGLESSSQGTKGTFFRARYPDMIMKDFFGSFQQRMEQLETFLAGKTELILVGSSYGGLMAAVFACIHEERVRRLVLLAPALHLEACQPFLNRKLTIPIEIFHGIQDEVVPLTAVRDIAERLFLNHTFTPLEDDHSLHVSFPGLNWDALLI